MTDMSNTPRASDFNETDPLDQNLDLLADVSLRLSVEVGSATMKLSDLLRVSQGSVVELDRDADAWLDIFANGTLIARGEVVSIEGRYAIRVAEIVDSRVGAGRRTARGAAERRVA